MLDRISLLGQAFGVALRAGSATLGKQIAPGLRRAECARIGTKGGDMEHVKVTFPTHRLVYIDGEESGHTNEILRVDAGTHVFELGNLQNFRPASRNVSVQDTTVLEPRVIAFFRKDDA
jgi:hypothetical protein